MLKFISNTYAGMPLNSSEVINGISLILLCSLGGFFVGAGSSTLTGSSGFRSEPLTLQNRRTTYKQLSEFYSIVRGFATENDQY